MGGAITARRYRSTPPACAPGVDGKALCGDCASAVPVMPIRRPVALDGFRPVRNAELLPHRRDMSAHGDVPDPNALRDLTGAEPVGHELEHLPLARGGPLTPGPRDGRDRALAHSELVDDPRHQRAGDCCLALHDALKGMWEAIGVGVLQQEPARTREQGSEEMLVTSDAAEHHDGRVGSLASD